MTGMEVDARIEGLIRAAGQTTVYPETPDLRARVAARLAQGEPSRAMPGKARQWAYGAAAVVLAVVVILAGVPQVRAGVGEWLRVGAVRILLRAPEPDMPPIPPTPIPDLVTWDELEGETTLDAAADAVSFDLLLPTYPRGLGMPDRVFVQQMGAPLVVLIWLDGDGEGVELALFEMGTDVLVQKVQPQTLQEVTVRGQRGVWATGPYLVVMGSGAVEIRRLTDGETLIWEEGGVTFRLETRAGLEEALRMAESLQPGQVR